MTNDFSTFHESLLDLIKSFEKKNVLIKVNSDPDAGIVRIYGERSEGLALAKTGLEEIEELVYTTAEHHPYWNLLYNSSQILKIALEKWNDKFSEDELRELLWFLDGIKNFTENLVKNNTCE